MGACDFDELKLVVRKKSKLRPGIIIPGSDSAFHVVAWTPRCAPQEVLDLFNEYIGVPSFKIWKPQEARLAGYSPTDMYSPMPGWCCQMIALHTGQADLVRQLPARLRGLASQFVPPSVMNTSVVVDHGESAEYLKLSKSNRYCI